MKENIMGEYILSCGSTVDLSKEYLDSRNIDCISFTYSLDGVEYTDDLGQTLPYDEFYARLVAGAEPKTAQVNINEYVEHFRPLLAEGKDVIHISLSGGITGTNNSANIAANMLKEEFPDRRLIIVDSLGASSGSGLIVDTLADMRDAGASLDELHEWVEANKLRLHHWFFSTDLSFYVKGGRISKTEGFLGNMLSICPLCNMDSEGRLIPREKVRTKKRVIKEIVARMEQHAENGYDYSGKCFISQSACFEDARAVADMVEERFPKLNGKVFINSIGPTIGSHTGPGTVALFFWGDERKE